jgi:hypothetical protein
VLGADCPVGERGSVGSGSSHLVGGHVLLVKQQRHGPDLCLRNERKTRPAGKVTSGATAIQLPAIDEATGQEIHGMYFACHHPKGGRDTCVLVSPRLVPSARANRVRVSAGP